MNRFLKELLIVHPELHEFYDSEQYQLSLKIIELTSMKSVTEEQFAEMLEMDRDYLMRLTSGDNTIPVSTYESIISKLESLQIK